MKNNEDLIGTKISWLIGKNKMYGLFLQANKTQAQVICYGAFNISNKNKMAYLNCHLKMWVDLKIINFNNQ